MADFHVHLKAGLTLEQALAKSRHDGIEYGIAVNCGQANTAQNDQEAIQFVESMKGQPCFVAMQAEGREWTGMFSRGVAAMFDYIFTDSMTWTDNRGKRMRLWMPDEVGTTHWWTGRWAFWSMSRSISMQIPRTCRIRSPRTTNSSGPGSGAGK
jgi:hypothetical protein